MSFINLNNKIIASDQFHLSVQNRAFRYGDGFFETIRCQNFQPLWFDIHFKRIIKSIKRLGLQEAADFTPLQLREGITELLLSNKNSTNARVRISFYRADGGLYSPISNEINYVIEASDLSENNYSLNKQGLTAIFGRDVIKNTGFLSDIKTVSALVYVMAGIRAREAGSDELIILNEDGNVVETISSNLFIVKNDALFTPSLDQGCIDGVMRKVIIDLSFRHQIKTSECALQPSDLLAADEVFITNAIRGIQWIKGLEKKRYFHKKIDLLTEILQAEVEKQIHSQSSI